MQHRILDQGFVAQVVPQALLSVQLVVPISGKELSKKQKTQTGDYKTDSITAYWINDVCCNQLIIMDIW